MFKKILFSMLYVCSVLLCQKTSGLEIAVIPDDTTKDPGLQVGDCLLYTSDAADE